MASAMPPITQASRLSARPGRIFASLADVGWRAHGQARPRRPSQPRSPRAVRSADIPCSRSAASSTAASTVMLGDPNNAGKWAHDGEKFVDGTYRIACASCAHVVSRATCARAATRHGALARALGEARAGRAQALPKCNELELLASRSSRRARQSGDPPKPNRSPIMATRVITSSRSRVTSATTRSSRNAARFAMQRVRYVDGP